jgi:hypothetical protein
VERGTAPDKELLQKKTLLEKQRVYIFFCRCIRNYLLAKIRCADRRRLKKSIKIQGLKIA